MTALFRAQSLTGGYGHAKVLREVSFEVRAGEVLDTAVWTHRLGPAVAGLAKEDGGYGARSYATLWESYCALRVLSTLPTMRGGRP